MCVAGLLVWTAKLVVPRAQYRFRPFDLLRFGKIAPMAMVAAVIFAFYEEIPASFLPIYALKMGYGETIAAVVLAVSAFGSLTGAIPLGWLSDKFGRSKILIIGACAGALCAFIIPTFAGSQFTLLVGVFIWGILVEGIYCVSLAMIADRFADEDLLHVNVSYGLYYAAGAFLGPLVLGESMSVFGPNGLFVAAGSVFAALFAISVWSGFNSGRR